MTIARLVFAMLLGVATLSLSRLAIAQEEGRTVVILTSRDDEVTTRLRKQVSGIGLHPSVVVSDAHCTNTNVTQQMVAQTATSVLCVDDTGISVWGLENSVAVVRERIEWAQAPPQVSDPALVQATETVRANDITLQTEASDRAVVTAYGSELEGMRPPPEPVATRPTRATVHGGIGFVGGLGDEHVGASVAAYFGAEARLHRWLSAYVNAGIPLNAYSLDPPYAEARTVELQVGALVPFAPDTSWLIPKLALGTGLVALYADPIGGLRTGRSQLLVSPMFSTSTSFSLRLYGPVRLAWSFDLGVTTSNMVVRVDGADNNRFGWPFYMTQLALEVQLR